VNTGRLYATNAIDNGFYQGDIQSCPHYGLAAYAGNWSVVDSTMENGFDNQTGFDMYGEAPSGNHVNRCRMCVQNPVV